MYCMDMDPIDMLLLDIGIKQTEMLGLDLIVTNCWLYNVVLVVCRNGCGGWSK